MTLRGTAARLGPVVAVVAIAIWIVQAYPDTRGPAELFVSAREITLPADGVSTVALVIGAAPATIRLTDGARRVSIDRVWAENGRTESTLRAGVLSGTAELEAGAPGFAPVRIAVRVTADTTDSFGDGLPDALRLDGQDADAFRQWFAWLAEAAYATEPVRRSPEIVDCAALLRFAYREALREHDSEWASGLRLDVVPALSPIHRYHYPYTPLGDGLFRVPDGAFAQFADADTLRRFNTYLIGRDIRVARQGDLLFYRQESQRMPDHAMIFLEQSQSGSAGGPWVVYHTGPSDDGPGEIRRPSIADLSNHPEPRWRPTPANPNFLGVYRWNILR
ncbi:MAG TPA: DUF1175 family protein [Terriglobia bacterium]|nr:DUF1175 family protein [Terriglobia bacterium]